MLSETHKFIQQLRLRRLLNMDIALGIQALLPAAEYFGSTTANTKACFDDLSWLDERPKPTWKQVQDAYNALPEEIKNPPRPNIG
jgi:hypothetical protein